MINTYENMREVAKMMRGGEGKNLSEIALMYQEDQNPIYLAHTFTEQFGHLNNVSNQYFYLTPQDKASILVEEVHKAMLAYKYEMGTQVQTLITTYVNNRFRCVTEAMSYQKRCINNSPTSYEVICSNNKETYHDEAYDDIQMHHAIENLGLSENELWCCKIIMSEPHQLMNTEIADKMGITSAGVSYIKKQLERKLQPIMAC